MCSPTNECLTKTGVCRNVEDSTHINGPMALALKLPGSVDVLTVGFYDKM